MRPRLLELLRCPTCGGTVRSEPLLEEAEAPGREREVVYGLLHCDAGHWFPVVDGIPRMLPDSLHDYWGRVEGAAHASHHPAAQALLRRARPSAPGRQRYDRRTMENFSLEWDHHQAGGRTWGIELEHRVKGFFLDPIRMSPEELDGAVMLDAGCGNGSQSVAYTELGVEVVAMDLSSGLEHGQSYRRMRAGARPDRVHFVQGDLQRPPLAPSSFDLIHSAGVLHHTPDTEATFRTLCRLLRDDGTFYVWLYSYEPVVTPVVNALRAVTTRIPPSSFARVAERLAGSFQLFCAGVDRLGLRSYPRLSRKEAALALMDIFGAPHAHYHSFPEVVAWYRSEGFDSVWDCNHSRRGFGACGRRAANRNDRPPSDDAEASSSTPGRPEVRT